MKTKNGFLKNTENQSCKRNVRRVFNCIKCKEEVIYLYDDINIMERAEENEGVFCSAECEYSFYNGGDGSDY